MKLLATFQSDPPDQLHEGSSAGDGASASDDGDEESTAKPRAEEDEEKEDDEDEDEDEDEVDSKKVPNDIKDAYVGGSIASASDGDDEGPLGTAEPRAESPAKPPAEDIPRQPAPAVDLPGAKKGAKRPNANVDGSAGDDDDEDDKVKKQKREKKKARQLARQSPAEKSVIPTATAIISTNPARSNFSTAA